MFNRFNNYYIFTPYAVNVIYVTVYNFVVVSIVFIVNTININYNFLITTMMHTL
jgi:hypothetical protein